MSTLIVHLHHLLRRPMRTTLTARRSAGGSGVSEPRAGSLLRRVSVLLLNRCGLHGAPEQPRPNRAKVAMIPMRATVKVVATTGQKLVENATSLELAGTAQTGKQSRTTLLSSALIANRAFSEWLREMLPSALPALPPL